MEAIRQFRTVSSGKIIIENLEQYSGQRVEVIILPLEGDGKKPPPKSSKSLRGYLRKYANPKLLEEEETAWQTAVKEKHENL